MNTDHTPLPWRTLTNSSGITGIFTETEAIAIGLLKKDAEHIIECVNAHDQLFDALEYCIKFLPSDRQEKYEEFYTLLHRLGSTI